jgi:hypothetical protein
MQSKRGLKKGSRKFLVFCFCFCLAPTKYFCSYNQTDEIMEKCDSCPADGVVLILAPTVDPATLVSIEDLRSLARAPTAAALASVQKVLTHVTLSRSKPTHDKDMRYLPMALSDLDLFTCLPHLVRAGVAFTRRPAALLALVAVMSGNALLSQRATRFLDEIRGTWIPLQQAQEFPECFTVSFVKLLLRVPQFLTPEELQVYTRLSKINRLRSGRNEAYPILLGFEPKLSELTWDEKLQWYHCCFSFCVCVCNYIDFVILAMFAKYVDRRLSFKKTVHVQFAPFIKSFLMRKKRAR